MSRLTRLFIPICLGGLLTSAIVQACGGHSGSRGEMPAAAPRPDPVGPSGAPIPGGLGASTAEGSPVDADVDAEPPTGPRPISGLVPGSPTLVAASASQPGAPAAPGAPSQPGPSAPSPSAPSQPGPSAPSPGAPSQPGSGAPPPGAPSQPGPSVPSSPPGRTPPGTSSQPGDAGVADSYSPPLPPVPDAGIPADARLEPILRKW